MTTPHLRPLATALALGALILLAACGRQGQAPAATGVVITGTAAAFDDAVPVAIAFAMIDAAVLAYAVPKASSFVAVGEDGLFLGPLAPIAEDGSFELALPDPDDVPQAALVTAVDLDLDDPWRIAERTRYTLLAPSNGALGAGNRAEDLLALIGTLDPASDGVVLLRLFVVAHFVPGIQTGELFRTHPPDYGFDLEWFEYLDEGCSYTSHGLVAFTEGDDAGVPPSSSRYARALVG